MVWHAGWVLGAHLRAWPLPTCSAWAQAVDTHFCTATTPPMCSYCSIWQKAPADGVAQPYDVFEFYRY